LDDLAGKRIVVQQDDFMHHYLLGAGLQAQITTVGSQEAVLRELAEGLHDCAFAVRISALHLINKRGWNNLVLSRKPFLSPEYCYAVMHGQSALLASFSEGLNIVKESGELRRIYDKWLGVYEPLPPDAATIRYYVVMVTLPLLIIICGVLLWSWALRRQVAKRTAELREHAEFQRAMIACSPVALYSIDLEGRVLTWNISAERIFGWTAAEIIGMPLPIVPEDKLAEFEVLRRRVLEAGAISDVEVVRRRKDGSLFDARLSASPIHDAQGSVVGIMGSVQDITEHKRAEESLRRSEEQYRLLYETMAQGVVYQDTEGRLIHANPAAERMLGLSLEEMLHKTSYDSDWHLIREDGSPLAGSEHPAMVAVRSGKPVEQYALGVMNPRTKKHVWISVSAIPLFQPGDTTPFQVYSTFEDITGRRQAEQEREKLQAQLHQAQKLESVGRLAGGVAHDFNNMLQAILGYAELALHLVRPEDAMHAHLLEIQKAAQRSADLTRQLLAFARRQVISPRVIDLNETVEGMLKMLRRLIGEDIDLAWLPGKHLWPVRMDQSQIDQILANLCVNARDAITGVGKVTIETDNVTFDETYCCDHPGFVAGDYVLLAVSDSGCGMDRETMAYIFEPFFTTKGIGEGTGLGLATVYGIVKQNKGFINVYSEPAQGTTFRIYLPRHDTAARLDTSAAAGELITGGSETILLVEDEQVILHLAETILTRQGYTVLPARTPGEAMRLAAAHAGDIHLLITDVVMPEMNGRELAGSLMTRYPGLRCLFMSGYTANVIAHHGVLDPGVHFIQKPFSIRDITAKVREALDRQA
jgi:PAS domain S-box-containing protein